MTALGPGSAWMSGPKPCLKPPTCPDLPKRTQGHPSAPQPCFPAPRPRAAGHTAVPLECWRPPWTTDPRVTGRGLARPVPAPQLGLLPALLVLSPCSARDAVQRTGHDVPPWLSLVGGGGAAPTTPRPFPGARLRCVPGGPLGARHPTARVRRCPAVAGSNP